MTAAAQKLRPEGEPYELPSLEVYARQFRAKFGRDMTPDERRFYLLTREVFKNPPSDDDAA